MARVETGQIRVAFGAGSRFVGAIFLATYLAPCGSRNNVCRLRRYLYCGRVAVAAIYRWRRANPMGRRRSMRGSPGHGDHRLAASNVMTMVRQKTRDDVDRRYLTRPFQLHHLVGVHRSRINCAAMRPLFS